MQRARVDERGGAIGQQTSVDAALLGLHLIGLQAAQAALMAAIVFAFGHKRRRVQLHDWGWAWAALSTYYLLLVATFSLEPGVVRVVLRVLGGSVSLCGALWLVQGTLALLDWPRRPHQAWLAWAAVAGAASALLPLLLTDAPLLSYGGAWLMRCLVVGCAYTACALLLWKHSGPAAIGRVLLPAAFLLYGAKLFVYFALGVSDILHGALQFRSVSLLGLSDLWLQAVMGLGTMVWLLEREHERLKELDRLKSDLLANVSHELRTPLTAIVGYADLLLTASLGPLGEAQQRALTVVLRNGERLSRSVGALLDFARLDAGHSLLALRPFGLAEWFEQTLAPLRPELDRSKVTLALNLEPGLPPVIGDAEKLAQVLENLVVNAMKFTPAGGGITLSAQRVDSEGRPAVEIRVTDTGLGIPAAQLEHVFERFFQVDASRTRKVGGVGLGLAIVKGILDAHGAGIRVESELGRGSSFMFLLPVHEQALGAVERADQHGDPGVVLVVEDDQDVQRFTRAVLQAGGFTVLSAFTSEEGAALAARERPDLVLLDVMLPDRSGLDLLQALKARQATADIPVIVLSATQERMRALSLGAADYLRKPIDEHALLALATRVLRRARHAGQATVLVVDDELDTCALLREALAAEGWRVLTAQEGGAALRVIAEQRPDVVLLDLTIPGPSGFDVLAALGREPETARIPVLVLSARSDDTSVRRSLELGARKYLSKPFDMRELVTEVRRQLTSPVSTKVS